MNIDGIITAQIRKSTGEAVKEAPKKGLLKKIFKG